MHFWQEKVVQIPIVNYSKSNNIFINCHFSPDVIKCGIFTDKQGLDAGSLNAITFHNISLRFEEIFPGLLEP